MSEQISQSSELPWGKRPLTVRDMALIMGFTVFVCLAGVIVIFSIFRSQPDAAPTDQISSRPGSSTSQPVAQGSRGPGQALFEQKCVVCHTIGGGVVVGPDLEGVTSRRDSDWLARWIAEPDTVLAEGDPIATELFEEFNNIPMTNLGLSAAEVEDILAFLENPGGVVSSASTAATLPQGNPDRGEAIFSGATRLQNGAPACISCHSTTGVGILGGGTLGPDLTNVHERYGDAGLPTALQNLPFPTMQGVFSEKPLTDNEVADLYAYFTQANQKTVQAMNNIFVLVGLVGFGILILLSQLIWRKRLKNVREPLLGGAK